MKPHYISVGLHMYTKYGRRPAIIWTSAGLLSIGRLGTNFDAIWINCVEAKLHRLHENICSKDFIRHVQKYYFNYYVKTPNNHVDMIMVWLLRNLRERIQLLQLNSLWPSDAMCRQRSGSTLVQVMASCLTAPSHYLNQCWLIISEVQWHSY